ncbi:purine-binding chemotaxis protein CheW [Oricola cellulosilytica]|uniref:Purine-binding chemotaxis protein CheW n=2 Tax=Oricola cellulosilytica TaxID=1429082 RepID=A0A4R0P278_9HYPH|nr:purine-binding chemotaxis protein CheW [Oricola cellulosilytica]
MSIDIISFRLGDQIYCVDIMAVREIRGWAPCTSMPHSPPHVLGVINLRGTVIPVVDAAIRIGLQAAEPTERSAIIVIDQGATLFGLLVESVSDMIRIRKSDLQPVPDVLPEEQKALAKAIVALEKQMICFLDPEPLIGIHVDDIAA